MTEKEERAIAQRAANDAAKARGEPLPYPNVWDFLDPTKVPGDATPEEVARSYEIFAKICRRRPRIRYVL